MLGNINEILTQARAIQIKNPDGSLSFKMVEVVPGSLYSKLNIQDGDIITGINGKKIKNLNEIMALFGKIRSIDHFELSVKRNGIESSMDYDFE
ncbi:MAG: PDZ domain-containing protein [Halobacteriovoraceae bacterium]|nr:PDZ domain-containing protein [Halobacteriovoraceae bacterium]